MVRSAEPDTFHVVAIGLSGSGKTMYLAALHHLVGAEPIAPGISITTGARERSWLKAIYNQATDPKAPWPMQTQAGAAMRETTFKCAVSWTGPKSWWSSAPQLRVFKPMNVTFIDYAGEWIPDAHLQADDVYGPFAERAEQAHVLLGMIDGHRLLQYLQGSEAGARYFYTQLRPVTEFMREHNKPCHFVITKWDLFHGWTLDTVAAELLASEGTGFRSLVESRTLGGRWGRRAVGNIRLIPVSALGDFAHLDANSVMSKRADKPVTPLNVDVPLVAAVADVCRQAHEELLLADRPQKTAGTFTSDRFLQTTTPQADALTVTPLGIGINARAVLAFAVDSGLDLGRKLKGPARWAFRRTRTKYRRMHTSRVDEVKSEEAAVLYLARVFRKRLLDFDDDPAYAASLLTSK